MAIAHFAILVIGKSPLSNSIGNICWCEIETINGQSIECESTDNRLTVSNFEFRLAHVSHHHTTATHLFLRNRLKNHKFKISVDCFWLLHLHKTPNSSTRPLRTRIVATKSFSFRFEKAQQTSTMHFWPLRSCIYSHEEQENELTISSKL